MITNACVSAVRVLTEKANRSGLLLEPFAGNTPLADLMAASYNTEMDNPSCINDTPAEDLLYRFADLTGGVDAAGGNRHEDALSTASDIIASAVRFDLQLAKNTVNPIIAEVADTAFNDVKARQNTIGTVLAVVPDRYDSIWSSGVLTDMVSAYKDIPNSSLDEMFTVHPMLPEGTVLELMKTGSTKFDNEVAKFVEEVGVAFVMDTYTRYLVSSRHNEGYTRPDMERELNLDVLGRKRLVILHLIARKLMQEPLEDTNMSLGDYEAMMAVLVSQTGRLINRCFDRRARTEKHKLLIVSYPAPNSEFKTLQPEDAQITVNYDVYVTWLEAGGSPELLYGACVSDREMNYDVLLEKGEEYCRTWANRAALVRSAQHNEIYNNTIAALRNAMSKAIATLDAETTSQGGKEQLQARLTEALGKLTTRCVHDIYECSRSLVCSVIFPDTNAYAILTRTDVIAKANPDLNIREASLLATIEIVTEWTCKMISWSRVTGGEENKTHYLTTGLTLANTCQLIVNVLSKIVGEEVASHIHGEEMYGSALCATVATKIQAVFAHLIN